MGSDNDDEILLNASKLAIVVKSKVDLLVKKREELCAEITYDSDCKMQKLKSNLTGRFEGVKDLFENRVIYKNGVYFVIISVEMKGEYIFVIEG